MAAARGFFARAWLTAALVVLAAIPAAAIEASNRYRSPRNPERKIRQSTELIVLHTTEAAARGSLAKVSERGECHFLVTEEGVVYRIVDRDREAFHAGRSMWNGKEDVDKFSIGIECVGYHDQEMPLAQLHAIRDLVKELKKMYHLSDDKVVTHSQVAYGAPNKWQKKKHRGRKRCGMLFAMPSVRRVLELSARVPSDPDTRAKRLVVGDDYLAKVLYGSIDTMKAVYGKAEAKVAAPPPPAPKAAVKAAPKAVAKTAPQPSKPFRRIPVTIEDLKAQGYTMKGAVSKNITAAQIAGGKWNSATTYYTIRNKVIPGNMINPAKIEVGMCIWMK